MLRLTPDQKLIGGVLAGLAAAYAGLFAFITVDSRQMTPSDIKTELATLPTRIQRGTVDYLRSAHETVLFPYYPGDPVTRRDFRFAVKDARQRAETQDADASRDQARARQEATLDQIASQTPAEAPRRPASHD